MNKTALKTFVCSFVFTLFAIFGANELISRDKNERDIIIPRQNIALFLKKEPAPGAAGIQPVKKIELIKTAAAEMPVSSAKKTVVLPSSQKKVKKNAGPDLPTPNLSKEQKEDNPRKKLIIARLEKTELPPFTAGKKASKEQQPASAPAAKTPAKLSKQEVLPKAAKASSGGQPQELVLADARQEFSAAAGTEQEDVLLIPLERDGARPLLASEKIKVNSGEAEQQVAMLNFDKPINSIVKETHKENAETGEKDNTWQTMAEKNGTAGKAERPKKDMYDVTQIDVGNETDSPWVAAQGTKFPKNNDIKEKDYYKTGQDAEKVSAIMNGEKSTNDAKKEEVKVAGEVVKNLLIPIPEDILNDKDLMPQLVSDPKNKKLEERITREELNKQTEVKPETDEIPFITEEIKHTKEENSSPTGDDSGGILKSISSIFSSKEKEEPETAEKKGKTVVQKQEPENQKNDTPEEKNTASDAENKILPTEIRLSFQTNRAEISGKTLNWIQAFAKKTMENDYTILEIRIDGTSSYNLQQKRLNLLYNILTNLGLDYEKVNTVFTNREPNSFVLRTVKTKEDSDKKQFDPASVYYRKW